MIDNTPLRVFDDEVIDFLANISADLLKSPLVRQYPDLAAFAFYIRKANLLKLRDTLFPTQSNNRTIEQSNNSQTELDSRLGRGLCFHIAPGNIPINFAFTWIFGLLAGNANIVRLPSKSFPQVDALVKIINNHLAQHSSLLARNLFVQYPRTDTEQTAKYCAMADCRMIWGGDKTIAAIKTLPTSPRCVDICFADRYSFAIIDANAILAADDDTMKRLAENFYNDTWLMDQNACSSPQLICWLPPSSSTSTPLHGQPISPENSCNPCNPWLKEAQTKFWSAALSVAQSKYAIQDAIAVDKLTLLCEEAVNNPTCASITRSGNLLYREELSTLTPDIINHRGKAGYFFEYAVQDSLSNFITPHSSLFTSKFQTITYFGLDPAALRTSLIAHNCRGIDRIVPIGQAMDIGVVWDGHDLIRELSRIVNV